MSIRSQVTGIIGGLLFFVIGATALGLYWAEREALLQKLEESRGDQILQYSQSLKDALMVHDDLAAMNISNALLQSPGVIDAYAVSPRGMILAHGNPARVGQQEKTTNDLRATQPIPLGKTTAHAVVVYSPTYMAQAVEGALRPVAQRITLVALGALAVGLAAALFLGGRLIRPIQRIAEGTRRIASGDLAHRVALGRGNELKQLGHDFDKMAERLGEVDQMKKDFVSNITHELRSPLSAIESYLNLVTDNVRSGDSSNTLDHLAVLRNNATRLGRFIDDVLDLSKIESRALDLRMENLDLETLLGDVVKLFTAKAQERGVALSAVLPPKGLTVWADGDKMQQVLINLVGNALKFTPSRGSVTLSAVREKDFTRISVADTGPGISPEDREKIFDRFEQAQKRSPLPGTPKGTGLGLPIARGLVEAQGGRIAVESQVGKGTVFSVYLRSEA